MIHNAGNSAQDLPVQDEGRPRYLNVYWMKVSSLFVSAAYALILERQNNIDEVVLGRNYSQIIARPLVTGFLKSMRSRSHILFTLVL